LSKSQKGEGLSVIIDFEIPEHSVSKAEIRLVQSQLRELMIKVLMKGEEKRP
jgi:hypothetical protein